MSKGFFFCCVPEAHLEDFRKVGPRSDRKRKINTKLYMNTWGFPETKRLLGRKLSKNRAGIVWAIQFDWVGIWWKYAARCCSLVIMEWRPYGTPAGKLEKGELGQDSLKNSFPDFKMTKSSDH